MAAMLIRENIGTATDHWMHTVKLARAVASGGFNAVVYNTWVNEDNDGAPNAYGPLDKTGDQPLEPLRNATNNARHVFDKNNHNFEWRAVKSANKDPGTPGLKLDDKDERLKDMHGRFPLVRTSDPNKGFYISTTSTAGLNPIVVSYGAITPALRDVGLTDGELGFAIRPDTRQGKGFFFGDSGKEYKVGEISRNLFRTFFPRVNQEDHPVTFIVFPGVRAGTTDGKALDGKVRQQLANLSPEEGDHLVRFLSFPPELNSIYSGPRGAPPITEPPKPPGPSSSQLDRLQDALRRAHRDPEGPYKMTYLNLLAVLRNFGLRSVP